MRQDHEIHIKGCTFTSWTGSWKVSPAKVVEGTYFVHEYGEQRNYMHITNEEAIWKHLLDSGSGFGFETSPYLHQYSSLSLLKFNKDIICPKIEL